MKAPSIDYTLCVVPPYYRRVYFSCTRLHLPSFVWPRTFMQNWAFEPSIEAVASHSQRYKIKSGDECMFWIFFPHDHIYHGESYILLTSIGKRCSPRYWFGLSKLCAADEIDVGKALSCGHKWVGSVANSNDFTTASYADTRQALCMRKPVGYTSALCEEKNPPRARKTFIRFTWRGRSHFDWRWLNNAIIMCIHA